jgi:hypothetical protein
MNLRSPLGTQVFLCEARSEYGYAEAAYAAIGASDKLKLGLRREGEGVTGLLPR